jgi:hypothetical protein
LTPQREAEVTGIRLPVGASRADYEARLAEVRREKRGEAVYPPEEVCSREVMRTAGRQPRILLTNVNQLELLLTRQRDVGVAVHGSTFLYLEAHIRGRKAETACLIRGCGVLRTCGTGYSLLAMADRDKDNPAAAVTCLTIFSVPSDRVAAVGGPMSAKCGTMAAWRRRPDEDAVILNDCVQRWR